VQGSEAPGQIVAAIAAANRYNATVAPIDTLILARGGGSIEDLWSFNDERVAYAVFDSTLPVVSGVGHETDFTLVDFVADLRAPTPSAAAAAATPDRAEWMGQLAAVQRSLEQRALDLLAHEQWHLGQLTARLGRTHPGRQLDRRLQSLDERTRRLHAALERRLGRLGERRTAAVYRLEALNPQRVLGRGYSIVQRENGAVVRGPQDAAAGETLIVRAAQGPYRVTKDS
jgi:exodeoxyribonuclease VII large subunit